MFQAENSVGTSSFSNVATFGVADLPSLPATPTEVTAYTTQTQIAIQWTTSANT